MERPRVELATIESQVQRSIHHAAIPHKGHSACHTNNNNNSNKPCLTAIVRLEGLGERYAFLCNSQPEICESVKSFTHVHKTPIHSLSWECCNKTF